MKYVKIKAKTYNEAMMKLRMEYSDDAIPVSHRYVKEGGLLNSRLFAANLVELTAAIPEKRTIAKSKALNKNGVDFTIRDKEPIKAGAINVGQSFGDKNSVADKRIDNLGIGTQKNLVPNETSTAERIFDKSLPTIDKSLQGKGNFSLEKRFEKEFQDIKQTLNLLIEKQGLKKSTETFEIPKNNVISPYLEILEKNDFDPEDRSTIIKKVKRSVSEEDLKDKYKIEKTLKDLLKVKVLTSGPIKKGVKKKIIMFIGPTGVGKTTTMAKLGAIYALRENHSVSFITIDTYRIAATEQLKKYAGIMKIPIHVVNDQTLFKEVISKEKSDIIMVDTSGRSHKNDLKLSEIKSYADMIEYDFEKILCVSANTKKEDLKEVFNAFEKISFDSVIVTKVDETSYIGSVVDVADKYKKPIAYFTNGQEVPNDIFVAEPENIINMIVGGVNEYISP